MRVGADLLLSRPEDVSAIADDLGSETLNDVLRYAISGADRVSILSAYYGPFYIRELLAAVPRRRRGSCEVTLVLGVEQRSQMARAVTDLRDLQDQLTSDGFRKLRIRLVDFDRPFHVKLYYVRRGTQPQWFIGSANLSSAITGDRHELMLSLRGRHDQLHAYLRHLTEEASFDVEEATPIEVYDRRSFFLNGSLSYRPQNRVSLTYEAFAIQPRHRAIISAAMSEGAGVPYADPRPEGFGFSLLRAADADTRGLESSAKAPEGKQRVGLRRYAAETLYGYWLPSPYAELVTERYGARRIQLRAEMDAFVQDLAGMSTATLAAKFAEHVSAMHSFFALHGCPIEPRPGGEERFLKFVRSRLDLLSDPHRRDRVMTNLYVERMPDIWGDTEAAGDFEHSFFVDISSRMNLDRSDSWIGQVFAQQLDVPESVDADALRSALAEALKDGWSDTVWLGQADEEAEFDPEVA